MSSFDKRVCLWLNTASVPDKAKSTTLNRMNVGINNYRNLGLEPTATSGVASKAEPTVRVDYQLQDSIKKALNRLQQRRDKAVDEEKKEEGKPEEEKPKQAAKKDDDAPLFPNITRETFARGTPSATPRGSRPVTPRSGGTKSNTAPAQQQQQQQQTQSSSNANNSEAAPAEEEEKPFGSFAFGEANDDPQPPADEEDEEYMAPQEDELRRRLTIQKRQSRHAISAEVIDQESALSYTSESVPKTPEISKRTAKALETHHLFSFFDDADLNRVVDIMELQAFKRGETIVEKDTANDKFYVVVTGSVFVGGESQDGQPGSPTGAQKINVGGTFGDHGLLYASNSPDTISAAVATTQVCVISRETYKMITTQVSHAKREQYEGFLANVKFLKGLRNDERLQLADALKSAKYAAGDKIIKYGEEGVWFNIIVEGEVDVIGRDKEGNSVYVCSFGVGDCVGELEFLFKHKTVADVVAKSEVLRTAKMTSSHFEQVIGSAKEVLERQAEDDEVYTYYRNAMKQAE